MTILHASPHVSRVKPSASTYGQLTVLFPHDPLDVIRRQ